MHLIKKEKLMYFNLGLKPFKTQALIVVPRNLKRRVSDNKIGFNVEEHEHICVII